MTTPRALLIGAAILLVCFCLLPQATFAIVPTLFNGRPVWWNPPASGGVTLLQQAMMVALVLAAAGSRRVEVLALTRGCGISAVVTSACIVCLVMMPLTIALREIVGWSAFAALIALPVAPWLALISMVVGAPLSEELAVRGFLFPALAKPMGTAGAAIATSAGWTALHTGFPWYALASAFIFGLLLAYARVRTGSLWTCILAHGMFNLVPALVPIVYG